MRYKTYRVLLSIHTNNKSPVVVHTNQRYARQESNAPSHHKKNLMPHKHPDAS